MTLPVSVVLDGLTLLTVERDTRGKVKVYTSLRCWKEGTTSAEALVPAALVPGMEVAWKRSGAQVYGHEVSASGATTDTYFNAGGVFSMKLPLPDGILLTHAEKVLSLRIEIGEVGRQIGSLAVSTGSHRVVGRNWKYSGSCGGCDRGADDHDDHDQEWHDDHDD